MIAAFLSLLLFTQSAAAVSPTDYDAIQHHLTLAANLTGHAQQLEMDRAIRLTIQAYGLLPTQNGRIQMPRGTSAVEGFSQQGSRDWVFTYDPSLRGTFSVNDVYGPIRGNPTPATDAQTAPNGMTIFWVDPSRINPNGLAFLVDHEIEHFKSFMTPGKGNQPVAQQEIDIYSHQQKNLERYGYTPNPNGRVGPYENAFSLCTRQIAEYTDLLRAQSTLSARAYSAIQAWRHRNGTPVYAEGRTVFVNREELERIRQEAEALNASIQSTEEQRRQDQIQEALRARPLPPPADPATVFRPFIPPSSYAAEEPASLRIGAMIDMAAAACRGAWEEARSRIPIYGRLTPQDCATLANRAASQPHGCQRAVVERVVSMNRNGESLGIERLQAEAAAFNPAPVYSDVPEREPRRERRPCVEHGVWHMDCY